MARYALYSQITFWTGLFVFGKTGRRYVKLNSQAQKLISKQDPLWNYKRDYVTHKFKKEVRRLGIKNARFHDLRRTFGLNLYVFKSTHPPTNKKPHEGGA